MVSGIPRRGSDGLIVDGVQPPLLPLKYVENGFVVDAEAGSKLRTPFDELVRLLAVKKMYLLQDDAEIVHDAVRDDRSSRSAVNVEGLSRVRKYIAAILERLKFVFKQRDCSDISRVYSYV